MTIAKMPGLLSVLILVSVSACSPEPRSECKLKDLTKLARSLQDSSPSKAALRVLPGLRGACGTGLPAAASVYELDPAKRRSAESQRSDPQTMAMIRRVCPAADEVIATVDKGPGHKRWVTAHKLCEFGRFDPKNGSTGVVGSAGLVTWGMHQWLLDFGLTPGHANAITFALIEVERWNTEVALTPGITLVEGRGDEFVPGPAIHVSGKDIRIGAQVLTQLQAGKLADADVQHQFVDAIYPSLLAASATWRASKAKMHAGRLAIMADAQVPFATLVGVLNTASRVGFNRFDLMIQVEPYHLESVTVVLGPVEQSEAASVISLEIDGDGNMSLAADGAVAKLAGEPAKLRAAVKDLVEAKPERRHLVVSAAPTTDMKTLLAAIMSARGFDCAPIVGRSSCTLPRVTLVATGAHDHAKLDADQLLPKHRLHLTDDQDYWSQQLSDYHVSGSAVAYIRNAVRGQEPDPKLAGEVRIRQIAATGGIDRAIFERIAYSQLDKLHACYAQGLKASPDLNGRFTLSLDISRHGRVLGAQSLQKFADAEVEACLLKAAKRWRFPRPEGTSQAKVHYTLDFWPKMS